MAALPVFLVAALHVIVQFIAATAKAENIIHLKVVSWFSAKVESIFRKIKFSFFKAKHLAYFYNLVSV